MKKMLVLFALVALVMIVFVISPIVSGYNHVMSLPPAKPQYSAPKKTTVGVTYEITGSADAVSITLENSTNGIDQGDYAVPFRRSAEFSADTSFLYISAQIIRPTEGYPTITCRIIAENGKVL